MLPADQPEVSKRPLWHQFLVPDALQEHGTDVVVLNLADFQLL
jgi:hypothetical protein